MDIKIKCRINEADNQPPTQAWRPAGPSLLSPFAFCPRRQRCAIGHRAHWGFLKAHTFRPNEMRFTCSENLQRAGIFRGNRCMSALVHSPLLDEARTHPSRRQTRQQCASTGNTARSNE